MILQKHGKNPLEGIICDVQCVSSIGQDGGFGPCEVGWKRNCCGHCTLSKFPGWNLKIVGPWHRRFRTWISHHFQGNQPLDLVGKNVKSKGSRGNWALTGFMFVFIPCSSPLMFFLRVFLGIFLLKSCTLPSSLFSAFFFTLLASFVFSIFCFLSWRLFCYIVSDAFGFRG